MRCSRVQVDSVELNESLICCRGYPELFMFDFLEQGPAYVSFSNLASTNILNVKQHGNSKGQRYTFKRHIWARHNPSTGRQKGVK